LAIGKPVNNFPTLLAATADANTVLLVVALAANPFITPTLTITHHNRMSPTLPSTSEDEDETPQYPTSVYWSFDDRPIRASSLSLTELGLPLTQEPSIHREMPRGEVALLLGEPLSHWDNTDRLDLSVLECDDEPQAPVRPTLRSGSMADERLLAQLSPPIAFAAVRNRHLCVARRIPARSVVPLDQTPLGEKGNRAFRHTVPSLGSPSTHPA